MNTTRMVVETSPRLIWNDSRLTGHHCRILAEIMKFNVIPNLTSINLGHNVINLGRQRRRHFDSPLRNGGGNLSGLQQQTQ